MNNIQVKEKNELMVFSNEEFGDVRVVEINGEGWLVGKDIADKLGYKNLNEAITTNVDEEDRIMLDKNSIEKSIEFDYKQLGQRGGWVVNESGMYALVLGSNIPSAKRLKKWVTSEILPSIRKHGAYMTTDVLQQAINDPQFAIALLTNLQEEKDARKLAEQEKALLEEKIEKDEPYTNHSKAIEATETSIPFGSFSELLYNAGINMGQNAALSWCRKNKFLVTQSGRRNEPTKKSLDLGIIEVDVTPYGNGGKSGISRKPVITPKGQMYLMERILKDTYKTYSKVSNEMCELIESTKKFHKMTKLTMMLMVVKPHSYIDEWNGVLRIASDLYEQGDDSMLEVMMDIEEMLSEE